LCSILAFKIKSQTALRSILGAATNPAA
jgi:hypothetical protein